MQDFRVAPRRPRPIVALAILTFLVGCSGEVEPPLRVAVSSWPGYSYIQLADELHSQQRYDMPVLDVVETASLSDSVRAYTRGQVDMLGGTLAELARINIDGNRPAVAIMVFNRSVGGDQIVDHQSIASLDGLKNRRVAFEAASANLLLLAAAIENSDLRIQDLELTPMPQAKMADAFADGRIDAAVTYPPTSNRLLEQPSTHVLYDSSQAPDAIVDVLIVASETLNNRSEDIQKLVSAHDQAVLWSRENPQQSLELIARYIGLSESETAKSLSLIEMLTLDEQAELWGEGGPLLASLRWSAQLISSLDNQEAPSINPSPSDWLAPLTIDSRQHE